MTINVKATILAAAVAAAAAGCAGTGGAATRPGGGATSEGEAMGRRIETAHGVSEWAAQRAVEADIEVSFGGRSMLEGVMLFETGGGRARFDLNDGTVLVYDGKRAWVSPATAGTAMARFHLLTWPYFMAAPFKLRDPGAVLSPDGRRILESRPHVTALLTFDPGVGDSPDDWYIVYENPTLGRLAAMAYIVTYGGKTVEEAEEEIHAIIYRDFETIDGVLISTTWDFYNWSRERGPHGDPIGRVELRNVRFVEPSPDAFVRPQDAREDPLPGG